MSTSVFPISAPFTGSPRSPLLAYLQRTGTKRKFLLEKVEHLFAFIFPETLIRSRTENRTKERRGTSASELLKAPFNRNFLLEKAER